MAAVECGEVVGDEIGRVRSAARLLFLTIGLTAGTWGALVPFAKLSLGLTHADLGLIMLAGGLGGITAMPVGGALSIRFGTRTTIGIGGVGAAFTLPALMLAPSALGLAAALFMIGFTLGLMDIASNGQGVIVEARSGCPAMSSFHGFFSLGGLAAPLLIGTMLKAGLSPVACAGVIAAVILAIVATKTRALFPHEADSGAGDGGHFAAPSGRAWLLGLFAAIFYMVEGTMFDWTALFLREYRAFDPAWAGLGLAGFSLTMTATRLVGDRVVRKFGPTRTVGVGAAFGACGILLAVAVPNPWVGILGFAVFGLGAANIVPVVFGAAGRLPGSRAAVSIAAVATLGNCGGLIGPAAVGFVSDAFSLPIALACGAGLVMLVAVFARTTRTGEA